jgi:poly(3-hydroxybutyrate) depolymerase
MIEWNPCESTFARSKWLDLLRPSPLGRSAGERRRYLEHPAEDNCSPATEVIFVSLTDGGHTWPDRADTSASTPAPKLLRFFLCYQR